MDRRLVLVVALLVGLAMACSDDPSTTDVARDDDGDIVESDDLGVFRIQVGDCLLLPGAAAVEVSTLEAVPCPEPHGGEVFALFDVAGGPDDPFPGDLEVAARAEAGCIERFDAHTGLDFMTDPDWDLTYLHPNQASWEGLDDREVVCVATPLGGGSTTEMLPVAAG